jgi:DNA polymerase-3 subunit gamma/tau
MEVFTDAEIRLRDASSKKILLEVALLKAIEARKAVSLDTVLKRLQDLRSEDAGTSNPPTGSAPASRPASAPAPVSKIARPTAIETSSVPVPVAAIANSPIISHEPNATTGSGSELNLEELWARLLEAVGRASPFTRSYLLEAHPVSFVKNVFVIGFAPEFEEHLGLVDNSRNHTLLQTKLSELGHPNAQFKFVKAEPAPDRKSEIVKSAPAAKEDPASRPVSASPKVPSPAATTPKASPPSLSAQPGKEKPVSVSFGKDDFKNDPLIQKALEIFKGQIIEVRA